MLMLSLPQISPAAVCPNLSSLGSLNAGKDFNPLKVAVDGKGNTYVTDNFNDNLQVFDYKGRLIKTTPINNPLGIAIDRAGDKIYIGRSQGNNGYHKGEVAVYDGNLNPLYKLGNGWGEFQYPGGITVNGSFVYVSDGGLNKIKIYNAENGAYVKSFGGMGTSDGSLTKPVDLGVYIDPDQTNTYVAPVDPWSDDFEDGVMGAQWTAYGDQQYLSESGGKLNINITPQSALAYVLIGYRGAAAINSDFDIQVDFENFTYVSGTSWVQAYFQVLVPGGDWANIKRVITNTGIHKISSQIRVGTATTTVEYNTAIATGKLRISRVGSTINVYYNLGSGWVQLQSRIGFSTADVNPMMFLRAEANCAGSVKFDNFKDNLFVVPPPPLAGDRLIIADRKMSYSTAGGGTGWGIGAGGHIFSKDGAFIKKFGDYGYEDVLGYMVSPAGLIIDPANRVLITDYNKGKLAVFDTDGNAVCSYGLGDSSPLPQGMAVGEDGRLFVAMTGGVSIYGLDDYVTLGVSPTDLFYDNPVCSSSEISDAISISNGGPGVLKWNIISDSPWLTAGASSGEINGIASVPVSITANPALLAQGTYTGTLTVKAQGAEARVGVTLIVPELPQLKVDPESFAFEVTGKTQPPSQTLNVTLQNGVAADIMWDASSNAGWVGVSPSAGSTNTTYMDNISVNVSALDSMASGDYAGAITINSLCATNGPISVPVTLKLIKGGTVTVNTNYADAEFMLSGPQALSGSGTSATFETVPAGSYIITFADAKGMIEPASYSLEVKNGETTIFNGNYSEIAPSIVASAGSTPWIVPEEIKIYSETGALQAKITVSEANPLLEGSRHGTTTAVGDIDGDGLNEIIAGHDMGAITGYRTDGTKIDGLEFKAFPYDSDVVLSLADLNADGKAEIIVGAGDKSGDQSAVRVFSFSDGIISDTGVYFLAYQEKKGVNIASGDVDGDGAPEIITTLAGSGKRTVMIRVWKVSAASVMGAWTVSELKSLTGASTNHSTAVAAGDVDGDNIDEIVVSVPDTKTNKANISAININGEAKSQFSLPCISDQCQYSVSAGDLDNDGTSEMLIGDNGNSGTTGIFIFNANGSSKGSINAYDNPDIHGVRVSLGQLMGD